MPEAEELKQLTKIAPIKDDPNRITSLQKPKRYPWIVEKIYILTWIRDYNREQALSDLIAGITLGLTIIPQSLAYAALAGLPSQYGLYAAFMGSLIYVFFGTVKEVSIGPTSLMSLLILQYTFHKPPEFAVVLGFMAGLMELLMGLLKLGFIVDFISAPVTSAFTSATAIIIIGSQLKNLLGIKYESKGFFDSIVELCKRIGRTSLGDSTLGLIVILFLLGLRQITRIPINTDNKRGKLIKRAIWYLSISRNALAVLITSVVAYNWAAHPHIKLPFVLSAHVEPGIPSFNLPPFHFTHGNTTYTFFHIIGELGSGIFVIPVVAVLANVAIAKAFATSGVNATQEMLALGLCNLIGSFFKSSPTCGAFTRSAVSQASGVRTPLAGVYSGTMVLLALSLLTPYFHFIPKSTLAAVLICAVIFMIDFQIVCKLWRESKRDLIGWFACIIPCLVLGVEIGLLCGVIVNVFHLVLQWSRPKIEVRLEETENMQYIYVFTEAGIYFSGIDFLREKILDACNAANFKIPVVLDCKKVSGLDFTAIRGLHILAEDLHKKDVLLILTNMEDTLQNNIDTAKHVSICTKEFPLKEILIQENIQKGRYSFHLGYTSVEPEVKVES